MILNVMEAGLGAVQEATPLAIDRSASIERPVSIHSQQVFSFHSDTDITGVVPYIWLGNRSYIIFRIDQFLK